MTNGESERRGKQDYMDHINASDGAYQETPLFDASRRGYDPAQVDRYLEQQQARLEETLQRAEEAEHRLGTAIKQLRAMNSRITQLEQERQVQPQASQPSIPIDILGDRVQRILQEAWDGAFALRQSVENESKQLREQAISEAQSIVEEARAKARSIEEQMRRRRDAYLARVEQDKSKAVAQMTFLSDQRKAATAELLAIKERIEAAIADVPTQTAANLSLANASFQTVDDLEQEHKIRRLSSDDEALLSERISGHPSSESSNARISDADLAPTMPVHMLPSMDAAPRPADTSSLVRSHRELSGTDTPTRRRTDRPTTSGARVFDFEANQEK